MTTSVIQMIPWPVSGNHDYQSSILVFEKPVTVLWAQLIVTDVATEMVPYKIMLETCDLYIEEEASLLQCIRSAFG